MSEHLPDGPFINTMGVWTNRHGKPPSRFVPFLDLLPEDKQTHLLTLDIKIKTDEVVKAYVDGKKVWSA